MTHPFRNSALPPEERVEDLVGQLNLEEKVSLMAGAEAFELAAIPRLGISSLRLSDGPTGVRSNSGAKATVFPVAVALAATFNPAIAREVAGAIAREAIALGERVVLAPTINIVRTPLWGRNFETYSEDPHLTAEMGRAYVDGLQSQGVGASLKHFALNNQEKNRFTVSVDVDERTLREVYLSAFESIVRDANPWTVMASYNRVRGVHASENPYLLTGILKGEWEYDGVVVSDWGAVHSTAPAVNAGLDLEMPGPPRHFGEALLQALRDGEASAARIDDSARRIVRLMLRTGHLDDVERTGELMTARHRSVARQAALESIVLLKNEDDLLPFDTRAIRSLAVIGPNAVKTRLQGDGSSRVNAARRPNILDSICALAGTGISVAYAHGVDNEPSPPAARAHMFSADEARTAPGLKADYFATTDFAGTPVRSVVERRFAKWIGAFRQAEFAALRWSGFFWPEKSGRYEFSVRGDGACRCTVGSDPLIGHATRGEDDHTDPSGSPALRRTGVAPLEAGKPYPICIEYVWAAAREGAMYATVSLGVRSPSGTIEEAASAARSADAAIVVVGSASTTESEGYDRADIDLPGKQNELVEAVLAANPRTVVVLNAGAAMTMPWAARAPAILAAWLPGEEGPDALASILFGQSAPSGRLPVSFPARLEDSPSFGTYPGDDVVRYEEGLFVGYRHFDRRDIAPLFPFGHGLTFTRFDYSAFDIPKELAAGSHVDIALRLGNTGNRAGAEAVQIYVSPLDAPVVRPKKELKAFSKVALEAGDSATVSFRLPPRAFSYFAPEEESWIVAPGNYEILAAASATDIRLRAVIALT